MDRSTGPERTARPTGPERFLVRGRVERLPRRRADRELLLRWVASRLIPVHEPMPERALTERLAELATDPVGLRRELVDAGLLTRTRDGAEYWRTHVTEFDSLGVAEVIDLVDRALADEPPALPAPPAAGSPPSAQAPPGKPS